MRLDPTSPVFCECPCQPYMLSCMLVIRYTGKWAAAHLKIRDEYISASDQTRFPSEKDDIFMRKQKDGSSTWNITLIWSEWGFSDLKDRFYIIQWLFSLSANELSFLLLGGRFLGFGLVSFLYLANFRWFRSWEQSYTSAFFCQTHLSGLCYTYEQGSQRVEVWLGSEVNQDT